MIAAKYFSVFLCVIWGVYFSSSHPIQALTTPTADPQVPSSPTPINRQPFSEDPKPDLPGNHHHPTPQQYISWSPEQHHQQVQKNTQGSKPSPSATFQVELSEKPAVPVRRLPTVSSPPAHSTVAEDPIVVPDQPERTIAQPDKSTKDVESFHAVDEHHEKSENNSIDPVFIPLKEWKRRKLEDIELQVKRFIHAAQVDNPTRLASHSADELEAGAGICLSYSQQFIFYFFRLACPAFWQHDESSKKLLHMGAVDVNRGHVPPMNQLESNLPQAKVETVPNLLDSYDPVVSREGSLPLETPSQAGRAASPTNTVSQSSDYDDSRHESQQPNAESTDMPSDRDELTGWTDVGSIGTARAIRTVTDFVKSIKEATGSLSSLTPGPVLDTISVKRDSHSHNGSLTATDSTLASNLSENSIRPKPSDVCSTARRDSKENAVDITSGESKTVTGKSKDKEALNAKVSKTDDKEKSYNFASADSGARVLSMSAGTVGAKNILDANKDKYLLTPCEMESSTHSRWIDIELSEEVIIERFQTGNFEYYSSSPRKVVILGASSYPPAHWNVLGMFDFANVKTLQIFHVQKRLVTRYLRVLFAGKQGEEYYCPISAMRVFGKNLIADWKDALDQQPSLTMLGGHLRQGHKSGSSESSAQHASAKKNKAGGKKLSETDNIAMKNGLVNDQDSAHSKGSVRHQIGKEKYESKESSGSPNPSKFVETEGASDGKEQPGDSGNETKPASPTKQSEKHISTDDSMTPEVSDSRGETPDSSQQAGGGAGETMSEDDQLVLEAVHADTLAPLSTDDNVFRKVTRMLRLLELNQTLTNQYIDTQLAKFAKAIMSLNEKADATCKRESSKSATLTEQIIIMKAQLDELQRESWRHDALVATLVVTIGVLVSALLATWSMVNGGQAQLPNQRYIEDVGNEIVADDGGRAEAGESIGEKSYSKKKRKKARDRRCSMESSVATSASGLTDAEGRSISSTDLVGKFEQRRVGSVGRSLLRSRQTGGAFDVLLGTEH